MRLLALGSLAKEEITTVLRQRGTVFLWQGIAGLCVLVIVMIGLISLHRYIGEIYNPYWADAAIAGLFAVLAIIALIVSAQMSKRAKRRQVLATTALAAATMASEALPDRKSTTQALAIAALAAGFWFGRKR